MYLAATIIVMVAVIAGLFSRNDYLSHDRARVTTNFEQVTQDNSILTLKNGEISHVNMRWATKYDSLLKVAKIKPKSVKQATIIQTVYRDTGSVKVVYREPILQPNNSYIIPLSVDGGCWGVSGQILTSDPNSKLEITERRFSNDVQALIIRRKRFLFWTIRKESIKVFSECGEANVTQVNFER
jgi:hypothetical protein